MPAYAVIGGQWGDEGKGKIIDYLAGKVKAVVRYAGGNNAGHTVINEKGTFQLHLIPSGICWPGVYGIVGNGVVANPDVMLDELTQLESRGIDVSNVYVSERAHVIMPYHIVQDALEEKARGSSAIGTTGQGVGPAYVDKVSRGGVRFGDLLELEPLSEKLKSTIQFKNRVFTQVYEGDEVSFDDVVKRCREWAEWIRPHVRSPDQLIHDLLDDGNNVLLEGAQGTMLDIDHGSYPYVTSSSPTIGGACTGLGISPQSIAGVLGVFKAYSTRVGSGPMPTELHGDAAENLREIAHEYGTTTGRARRVGWFDAVAGRYSRIVNGMTGIVLTRLDILDGFDTIKICNGYRADGHELDRFPSNTDLLAQCEPVYEDFPGWDTPTSGATTWEALPENAQNYVRRIQDLVGCPVQIISTGPNREETILLDPIIA